MFRNRPALTLIHRLTALIFCLAPLISGADPCIPWAEMTTPIAELDANGTILDIARTGNILFAGLNDRLLVADVDVSGTPVWIGELALPGTWLEALAVSGTTLVAAQGPMTMIIDTSDPANPQTVGEITEPCGGAGFAGDLLCLSDFDRLMVYNISQPDSPEMLGLYSGTLAMSSKIVGKEGACWAITPRGSVSAFDLSNPAAPALAGVISPASIGNYNSLSGVRLQDDVLYLSINHTMRLGTFPAYTYQFLDARLYAVDVSDLANPVLLDELVISSIPTSGLGLANDKAAVGLSGDIRFVDVGTPANLLLGESRTACGSTSGNLELTTDRAFIGAASLRVLDMTLPEINPKLGQFGLNGQSCWAPVVSGDILFITMGITGYPGPGGMDDYFTAIYDCSDPVSPAWLRNVGGPWGIELKAVLGDYLYAGSIWNWTTGEHVSFGGSLPTSRSIPVTASTLYETGSGLKVWDLTDPIQPVNQGTFASGHTVWDVAVDGDLVGLCCGDALVMMNAASPLAPVELSTRALTGHYTRASICDGWLSLSGPGGLQIVDIRDPAAPIMGGFLPEPGLTSVTQVGNIAYVANDIGETLVIDISGYWIPSLLGRYLADENPLGGLVMVQDNLFAIHGGQWGYGGPRGNMYHLATECSSIVANLVQSFTLRWDNSVCHLNLQMSDDLNDLRIVAHEAGSSRIVPWSSTAHFAHQATDDQWHDGAGGDIVYVAQMLGTDGTWIDLAEARTQVPDLRTTLRGPVPNPFNPATQVSFVLGVSGPVKLEVFGVDGRRIQTLIDEQMAAGLHDITWRGVDQQQQPVGAGTYVFRLQTDDRIVTKKAVLVQ
jgi:hypothetical protein